MKQEVLEKANAQANKFIEEARAAAARVQEQETQKAIAQAEQIVSKAREAATLERQRMLTELKREVVTLVVHTTAAVTGKSPHGRGPAAAGRGNPPPTGRVIASPG